MFCDINFYSYLCSLCINQNTFGTRSEHVHGANI